MGTLAGTDSGPDLTSTEVHHWRFTSAKFRGGYDQDEVDAFLDRVVQTLGARESAAASDPAQDPRDHPAPAAPAHALGLRDVTSKLQFAAIEAQGSDALQVRLPDGSTARVLDISAEAQGVTLITG
ncbi:MAG TPA: DivIVA domain-containing protein [Beutenbergiaceae bacterium]|nr:DivIVA domain-containing protein [Beutenbergiaceae bacterium]